jgi:hypothetical protein
MRDVGEAVHPACGADPEGGVGISYAPGESDPGYPVVARPSYSADV